MLTNEANMFIYGGNNLRGHMPHKGLDISESSLPRLPPGMNPDMPGWEDETDVADWLNFVYTLKVEQKIGSKKTYFNFFFQKIVFGISFGIYSCFTGHHYSLHDFHKKMQKNELMFSVKRTWMITL